MGDKKKKKRAIQLSLEQPNRAYIPSIRFWGNYKKRLGGNKRTYHQQYRYNQHNQHHINHIWRGGNLAKRARKSEKGGVKMGRGVLGGKSEEEDRKKRNRSGTTIMN